MISKFMENLSNPIRAKLLLELIAQEQLTTKELLEKFPDISQPTMYRHLKAMVTDGTLKVVGETQIRGTVEKSFAVSTDLQTNIERIVTENDGEGYLQLFTQYIISIMAEFKQYAEREKIDIQKDGSGFTIAPVYATLEELQEALIKVGEILMSLYQNKQTPERKLHNICIITTPPKA